MKRQIFTLLAALGLMLGQPAFGQALTIPDEAEVTRSIEWLKAHMSKTTEAKSVRLAHLFPGQRGPSRTAPGELVVLPLVGRTLLQDGTMIACGAGGACAQIVNIFDPYPMPTGMNFVLLAKPLGEASYCEQLECAYMPRLEWVGWQTCGSADPQTCALVRAVDRMNGKQS